MDRSPSLRTTTDRPDRRSSSCSSSAFGSDLDEFMSKSPSPINEKKDDTLKSWHSGANSPSRLGTPPKRASFATPLSVSTTFHPPPHGGDPPAISSSAPRHKSPSHREEVKREEPCVIKPCKDAAAQLQKTRQMLQRLDSHNDEMEGALTGLRARVDTYRSLVKNSLSKAVNGLRGDLRVLRESAQFLLHDFGVDMEQCEKIITRRIMRDVGGSLPESVSKDIRAGKGGKVSPSRAALQQTSERFGEQPSASTGLRELELQEDLIEAEQRCCALENKLKQQRETYEKHLEDMKDMYKQKEFTLEQRVKLLEHLVKRGAEKACSAPNDSNNLQTERKGSRNCVHDEEYSSDNGDCDTCSNCDDVCDECHQPHGYSPQWQPTKTCGRARRKSHGCRRDYRRRELSWDLQTPILYDDVERRVRAQLLRGRQGSPLHSKVVNNAGEGHRKVRECTSRLEERRLEDAARRLLNVVSEAYMSPQRSRVSQGAEDRRGSLWRASDDVSTVARGLWAENVLHDRTGWRY